MITRRKMQLNGEWQLDGRNQGYELTMCPKLIVENHRKFGHVTKFAKINALKLKVQNCCPQFSSIKNLIIVRHTVYFTWRVRIWF